MKLKKVCMLTLAALSLFAFTSCNEKNNGTTTKPTEVITTTAADNGNNDNIDKKYQIYLLAQQSGFSGTYEEWLESIKGDSISVIVESGKLKWKYSKEADTAYRELIDLAILKGDEGKGIDRITKKGSVGKVDTYTITFTDGTTTEFTVNNGQDGEGKAIVSVSLTDTNDLVDTYTITFSDASSFDFYVTNGAKGDNGADGKGIKSIDKVTNDLVDTYTITFTDDDTFVFTVTNGKDGEDADDTIVEYSDNGLTKIVYVYSDDSVEKIISAYTRNGWVNQTRVVSTFRTDGVALGTEQVEDREYNWDISEEKWVDTNIVTCYEYSLDGHKLLTKTVYEDDDSVMLLIHVYNYDINGNIIRDYYLKEATGTEKQFFKYGIEKVYSEELHCNTEVHYYWDGAEGIDIAKGKTTSYLYQFGSNVPFKYVELYYDITYDTSTYSYQYELTKCIEQNCDEFGTLIGEPAEKTLDYGSYVYFSSTPEYKMVIGNFETTYSGSYAFDMNALLIVPNSYNIDSGNVYTGDLLDKYYYTEYDLYSNTYRSATIRKPIVEEGIVVGASIDKYYNGEFVEKDCYVSYTHNELGLLVEQIWSYDWDNDLEKWTRFEKVEITWNANRKPTTIIGYNKVGENWVESFKTVQTWENDEIIETINYSWDPTANGGLGDWV